MPRPPRRSPRTTPAPPYKPGGFSPTVEEELALVRRESNARRVLLDEERGRANNLQRDLTDARSLLRDAQGSNEALTSRVADLTAAAALPRRVKLPPERSGVTHHLMIGDADIYLMVGLYPSGDVGEIFLRIAKQGSETSGWADQFAQTFSMLLQQGMPLEDLAKRFVGSRFEPSGFTNITAIRTVTSPVDLVARVLLRRYVEKLPLTER